MSEQIKQNLSYCDITGHFTWLISGQKRKFGKRAGSLNNRTGYRQIKIDGKMYQEHRLVWWYVHGYFPLNSIDHINGIRSDNRISNLREATSAENCQNRGKYKSNSSGLVGVSFFKPTGKWKAQIQKDGNKIHLGYHNTQEQAYEAYLKVKAELHTFQPEPRK
jgi:hypothetical protein